MIKVTRLNKTEFYINEEMIEFLEETPDTVITMNNGIKIVVTEKIDIILSRIVKFRIRVLKGDFDLITTKFIKGDES